MNDKCEVCKNYICDRCTMAENPYSCNTFTEREKHEFKLETSFNVNDDIPDFTKTLMNYSQIKIEKHIEQKLIEHGFKGEFNKENFRKQKVKIDFDIKNRHYHLSMNNKEISVFKTELNFEDENKGYWVSIKLKEV